MKIVLTKDDIMEMVCKKYNLETLSVIGEIVPEKDEIYWEGNPDEEMVDREAAVEPKKEKEEIE